MPRPQTIRRYWHSSPSSRFPVLHGIVHPVVGPQVPGQPGGVGELTDEWLRARQSQPAAVLAGHEVGLSHEVEPARIAQVDATEVQHDAWLFTTGERQQRVAECLVGIEVNAAPDRYDGVIRAAAYRH